MPNLTLLTRPGCRLCDEAWELILTLATEFDWQVTKIDISDDHLLSQRFGALIPVVDIEGGPLVYAPLTAAALLAAIAASQPPS